EPFQSRATHIFTHINAAHAERSRLLQYIDGEMLVTIPLQCMRRDTITGEGSRHILNGKLIFVQFELILVGSIHGFLPVAPYPSAELDHNRVRLPTLHWNNVAHICNKLMRIFA